jgi:hypothetical protein
VAVANSKGTWRNESPPSTGLKPVGFLA